MTKQEAIEGHRKMWQAMKDYDETIIGLEYRYDFKSEYCDENNLDLKNHCFLCEYDKTKGAGCCSKCPLDWCRDCLNSDCPRNYGNGTRPCECWEYEGKHDNWSEGDLDTIINLKEREI